MRVLVCGSSGCIGSAVVRALRWRGHRVVEARRTSAAGAADAIDVDFAAPTSVDAWAARLSALDVDAIVNCVGTPLPPPASTRADRLHGDGPVALFRGAVRAGVARIVHVSALDVDRGTRAGQGDDGWRAKRDAEAVLVGLDIDAVVVRPSLVYGPGSRSASALAKLARAPRPVWPGGGGQRLEPIHVYELAESIAALVERTGAARGIYELGGGADVSYRELLAALRIAQGGTASSGLALPIALARVAARLRSPALPGLPDADVLRLLEHARVTQRNAARILLGRAPSTLAEGLLVTPPARPQLADAGTSSPRASGARWLHHSRGVL